MFAPFSVASRASPNRPQAAPLLHWGNVDTGAMVSLVYSGVLVAFPALREYLQPFSHVVQGVGRTKTEVVGKLVDVPVCLGPT